jgi:hypothetical protein
MATMKLSSHPPVIKSRKEGRGTTAHDDTVMVPEFL